MSPFQPETNRPVRARLLAGALLCLSAAAPAVNAQAPELQTNQTVATAGAFQLSWEGGREGAVYQLQQAGPQGFANPDTAYRGPDTATQLSGLPNGEYHYRVRMIAPESSSWSQSVSVRVEHHPLKRALSFFAVGLIVFLATVVLIVRGSRRD